MASSRFFAYDPYDYYYIAPHHYPYPYYHHPHQHQQPAPARMTSGFFPVAAGADAEPSPTVRRAAANHAPRARSVSIPVHFVGSHPEPERKTAGMRAEPAPVARTAAAPAVVPTKRAPSKEAAAVRLQAAARGFLARRSVRAVREVEREAEEIQKKVEREAEELRRGDARARIAVGEALMRLLLRLDAVRGAREYRRRVTRRVLALQDAVDALEPKTAAAAAAAKEIEGEPVAVEMAEESAVAQELPDAAGHQGAENEAKAAAETAADEMEVDGDRDDGEPAAAAEETERASDGMNLDAGKTEGSGADSEGEWEMVTEEPAPDASAAAPEVPRQVAARKEIRGAAEDGGADARRLMEMVAALCERSAQQCAVIGALAERVDALERAVGRVEDAERRRRRAKKLRKQGKGSNRSKCASAIED